MKSFLKYLLIIFMLYMSINLIVTGVNKVLNSRTIAENEARKTLSSLLPQKDEEYYFVYEKVITNETELGKALFIYGGILNSLSCIFIYFELNKNTIKNRVVNIRKLEVNK